VTMSINTVSESNQAVCALRGLFLISRSNTLNLLAFVLFFFCAHDAGAAILHVGAGWSGSPYATIQAAVDAAASGGDEIWVEQGTYTLGATIDVSKSIALYGGFVGTETTRSQRNATANVTTVDGNSSVRCFLLQTTSMGTVTIDGFTITKGDTNSDSTNGPAISNGLEDGGADGGNLTVANCIISLNSGGKHGAISNETNGNLTVTNCTFTKNTTVNRGAALNHNTSAATMTVTGCTFSENSAGNGGAIYAKDTTTGASTITDCTFSKNQAATDGGAIIADQNITITRCIFDQNSCTRYGIFAARGTATAVFTNCVFSKNSTKFGVICLNGAAALGTLKVMNCTFTGNTLLTSGKGGAIYTMVAGDTSSSVFTVTNSILWGNGTSISANEIDRSGTTQLLPTVSYTDIDQTGYAGTISNSINQDPLFAGSSDYHLQQTSPCINTGTSTGAPSTDIAGTSRPQGAGYDMGAYEYVPSATTTTTSGGGGGTTTTTTDVISTTTTSTQKLGETVCPALADVSIDEWKPDENLNYYERVVLATNHNIHHGIARGLFLFGIPKELKEADVGQAEICLSACHHCGGGDGGEIGFYALNAPFNETTDTWNSLKGGSWDNATFSQAVLPGGTDWNTAVNGQPPPDVKCLDVTELMQGKLEKVRANGIMMRFMDEVQVPATWENVASRESTDPLDFAPYLVIRSNLCPAEVLFDNETAVLDLLRRFRDGVLGGTAAGRQLTTLYYRSAAVIAGLLENSPVLRQQSRAAVEWLLPHIGKLVDGTKQKP